MFLDKIVAVKRKEAEELAEAFSLEEAERQIARMPATKGFERALADGRKRALGLIAEVKKASPSKGLIRPDFHPVELAQTYERAGADCISVLTDRDFFQGSNDYLTDIRANVGVPLLRKDFTIDYRQIYEARLIGADAILLIAAILTPRQIADYHELAQSLGMDVLVEVHDRAELETVLELDKATLIGINNRNLKTFVTDLATTEELIGLVPDNATLISESGIAGPGDLAYLQGLGAKGVLIGEHFMRKPDVGEAVLELMGPVTER
ncbi:indole-3-glycerol phosphate synthase [Paenibacillus darwinianus]|uniref:Indole-3-glycerol phosphate synthase n=1 Tax=Paenibacillus darwinianus TaxID=1380763 RepID=A0A9W5S3K7_9BACL|nr:indole-3-glycerol phosphate synthase TrpC [Paenibacillus darwinianus]EXX91285.1 indole-3-glycerol phosphate synthase [Paenibacillus darwinianus]EXX92101.1 indole-3-glycerol phosphate synthase [Paenibacillus darwinianus]EXX92540.1 indole-3-glycerol phosphate synthase [Paenibacillus darwinianus]